MRYTPVELRHVRAALGMVEETKQELPASDGPGEHWPNRQDTREFQAVEPEAVATPDAVPEVDEVPKLPPVSVPEAEEDGPWAGRDFAWG